MWGPWVVFVALDCPKDLDICEPPAWLVLVSRNVATFCRCVPEQMLPALRMARAQCSAAQPVVRRVLAGHPAARPRCGWASGRCWRAAWGWWIRAAQRGQGSVRTGLLAQDLICELSRQTQLAQLHLSGCCDPPHVCIDPLALLRENVGVTGPSSAATPE